MKIASRATSWSNLPVSFAVLTFGALTLSCVTDGTVDMDGGTSGTVSKVDSGRSDAATNGLTEKGTVLDFETFSPLAGLTVTDNGLSATTDATGSFSLTVPSTAKILSPVITGPSYVTLYFPTVSPVGTESVVDFGTNVTAQSSTYSLEQAVLGNDQTKALIQVVVKLSGSCTSAVGGTLQVLSPPGTSIQYFTSTSLPSPTLTSFQDVKSPRPVVVIYNIDPGVPLTVAVTHPTCTMAPYPATLGSQILTGQTTAKATEPGDVTGALVVVLQ